MNTVLSDSIRLVTVIMSGLGRSDQEYYLIGLRKREQTITMHTHICVVCHQMSI